MQHKQHYTPVSVTVPPIFFPLQNTDTTRTLFRSTEMVPECYTVLKIAGKSWIIYHFWSPSLPYWRVWIQPPPHLLAFQLSHSLSILSKRVQFRWLVWSSAAMRTPSKGSCPRRKPTIYSCQCTQLNMHCTHLAPTWGGPVVWTEHTSKADL